MRWTKPVLTIAFSGLASAFGQTAPPAAQQTPAIRGASAAGQFVVVLDAAHGGGDAGASLGRGGPEKDLTLKIAQDLQVLLQREGFAVTMTRTADVDLPALDRAEIANHAAAAACLVIHATATGSGVHLFTSSISPAPRTEVLPWQTAQAAFITDSLKLESELDAAFVHAEIPVTMGRASVAPMDNFACPAVAVEVAPLAPGNSTHGEPVTDSKYQQALEGALAVAIASWHTDLTER